MADFKPPVLPPDLSSLQDDSSWTEADYQSAVCTLMEDYLRRRDPASARAALQYWLFSLVLHEGGMGPGVPGSLATVEAMWALDELLEKYRAIVDRLVRAN